MHLEAYEISGPRCFLENLEEYYRKYFKYFNFSLFLFVFISIPLNAFSATC